MINMNIAIVDIGWKEIPDFNYDKWTLGGSETWLVQISQEFAKCGNKVVVYCCTQHTFEYRGVVFTQEYNFLMNDKTYDFIILNRFFEKDNINYIQHIKSHHLAKHVYIQVHDLSLIYQNELLPSEINLNEHYLLDNFVTIVTLNEWHNKNLLFQYPQLTNTICCPNGIDLSLIEKHNNIKDNRILWSSCYERGFDILLNDIAPLVKKEIPDFGIDIAGYNDLPKKIVDNNDVRILGKLTKQELYKEMSKHKVWFYPGTFAETFCITMLENILHDVQIVSPLTYGMRSTIGYADEIGMTNDFQSSYDGAVIEAAHKIIDILNGNNAHDVYNKIKHKIYTEYNWTNSVNIYLRDFENISIKLKSNKKILILSMGCNNTFFKALGGTIRDTWAKPVWQGKYENVQWFYYTSCDKRHPVPCIDWTDHTIYVDCDDNINHTYQKTQMAYELIKSNGIEFDVVVRTNTSTFVHIENLIRLVNDMDVNDIYGGRVGFYYGYPDRIEHQFDILIGLFYIIGKDNFEIAFSKDISNIDDRPIIEVGDDVLMSKNLLNYYGEINYKNPNPIVPTIFPRYKAYQSGDEYLTDNPLIEGTFIDDPTLVNDYVCVQLRCLYNGQERIERGHEIEHFYELNDELNY